MPFKKLLSSVAVVALVTLPVAAVTLPLSAGVAEAAQANVSIDVFFDKLGDEGNWVKHPQYNYVWVPNDVSADWAPYTHGHWADTEQYGWTFVSDEPFAWAVYHYGRWGYDQDIGWFWVPGTQWAPAWVSWRRGHDAIGWAPLPPEGQGYAVDVKVSNVEPPRGYWHFVRSRQFLEPDLSTVIIRDETPYEETELVGPVVVQNNIVVNNVIDVDFVRQSTGKEVQVTKVQEVSDPVQAAQPAQQGTIIAVQGELAKPAQDVAPKKVVEAKEVKAPTKGQDIQATTGSIKPNEQGQTTGEAAPGAGQATGGEQATGTEQPKTTAPGTNGQVQEKAAKGTTQEQTGTAATEQPNKKLQTQQQGANAPATGENGQAAGKPEEKAAKGTTEEQTTQPGGKRKLQTEQQGANAPTEGQNGQAAGQPEQKAAKGATEEQTAQPEQKAAKGATEGERPDALKPKKGKGTSQNEAQAPAATKQGEQAQGATGEQGNTQTAQKKLKKPQGGEAPAVEGQNETGKAMKGAGQAAEQAAPDEQDGQAAKGPRKLKQAEQQQPSQEKTGAIPEAKGGQGGGEASPKARAPKAEGKAKGACSAEQQAAGSC